MILFLCRQEVCFLRGCVNGNVTTTQGNGTAARELPCGRSPPYVFERGGLPRVMTFKAVPFGSTVSHLYLPYPILAAPRANVPEGLSSLVLIEKTSSSAVCGPWPAVPLSPERQ
jgi:hypothetical protein